MLLVSLSSASFTPILSLLFVFLPSLSLSRVYSITTKAEGASGSFFGRQTREIQQLGFSAASPALSPFPFHNFHTHLLVSRCVFPHLQDPTQLA